MYKYLTLALFILALSGCSYHARNKDYRSAAVRRATKNMLSVDFVDLIVEKDDENVEDYVSLPEKKPAAILIEKEINQSISNHKQFRVLLNDDGEWIYVQE